MIFAVVNAVFLLVAFQLGLVPGTVSKKYKMGEHLLMSHSQL